MLFLGILCKGPGSTAAPAAVYIVLSKPELILKKFLKQVVGGKTIFVHKCVTSHLQYLSIL